MEIWLKLGRVPKKVKKKKDTRYSYYIKNTCDKDDVKFVKDLKELEKGL